MPAGRPTLYDPEYHPAKALEYLKRGLSLVQVSARLDIGRTALYAWIKKHPEFANTIKDGLDYSEAWWMDQAQDNLNAKHYQTGLWIINMKNRFGWQDKIHAYVTENKDVKGKTDEQIKEENAD